MPTTTLNSHNNLFNSLSRNPAPGCEGPKCFACCCNCCCSCCCSCCSRCWCSCKLMCCCSTANCRCILCAKGMKGMYTKISIQLLLSSVALRKAERKAVRASQTVARREEGEERRGEERKERGGERDYLNCTMSHFVISGLPSTKKKKKKIL